MFSRYTLLNIVMGEVDLTDLVFGCILFSSENIITVM